MSLYAKIITDDKRFERMLFLELTDCGIEILSDIDDPRRKPTKNNFVSIVDLDFYSEEDISELRAISKVVGFSYSYAEEIGKVADLCDVFFHRPFLMSDLFTAIFSDGGRTNRYSLAYKIRNDRYAIGDKKKHLTIDHNLKNARYGNEIIHLTDSEYKILSVLDEKKGEAVSRDMLSAQLGTAEGNICDVYICMLRKKLDNRFGVKIIKTVRGRGYMI